MNKNFLKALAFSTVLSSNLQANAVQKIAVADLDAIISSSDYANEVGKVAQDKQNEMQKLMNSLSQELEAKSRKMQESVKGEEFNALVQAQMQSELMAEKKIKEAQFEKESLHAKLAIEKADNDCKNRVKELAKECGKKHGFDLVLDKNLGVLVCSADCDITDKVKSYIADEFKKERRKAGLLASVSTDKVADKKDAVYLAEADSAKVVSTSKAA